MVRRAARGVAWLPSSAATSPLPRLSLAAHTHAASCQPRPRCFCHPSPSLSLDRSGASPSHHAHSRAHVYTLTPRRHRIARMRTHVCVWRTRGDLLTRVGPPSLRVGAVSFCQRLHRRPQRVGCVAGEHEWHVWHGKARGAWCGVTLLVLPCVRPPLPSPFSLRAAHTHTRILPRKEVTDGIKAVDCVVVECGQILYICSCKLLLVSCNSQTNAECLVSAFRAVASQCQ